MVINLNNGSKSSFLNLSQPILGKPRCRPRPHSQPPPMQNGHAQRVRECEKDSKGKQNC